MLSPEVSLLGAYLIQERFHVMFVWSLIFLFHDNMNNYLKLYYYQFACIFSEFPTVKKSSTRAETLSPFFIDVSTKPRTLPGPGWILKKYLLNKPGWVTLHCTDKEMRLWEFESFFHSLRGFLWVCLILNLTAFCYSKPLSQEIEVSDSRQG